MKKETEQNKVRRLQQQQTAAPVRRPKPVQQIVPAHHLPPNKTLFVQNLPDSATKEQLVQIYGKFDGFREVRMVPGRKGIAFVEYDTEGQAGLARVNTSKLVMDGQAVQVMFQRKIN
jgi:U2 small nuclear ribonucleoprotein B''